MFAQPGDERAGLAVREQRHGTALLQVHQHRAIGVSLAQRPIVHAQHRWCGVRWYGYPPDQAQQGVPARDQSHAAAEAHTGCSTERQVQRRKPIGQPRCLACLERRDAGQAFGKDTTLAPDIVAEEFSYAEPDGNGVFAPGQVGQGALVLAVGPPGPPTAEQARRRMEAGGHG